ncbi:hypothetical protein ACFRMN_19855 [Streptomyces sp. NPDC056835]|uniref:hypothetical protein n=1 Tax=Streptomyces sp. NPDC056835 TaxID=3345956 RepID=UPI0036C3688B
MNRPTRKTPEWQIGPVAGQSLSRDQNGQLTLPLQVVHLGKHVATSSLLLTVAEAEQLHASLCYALDGEPMPDNAPDCRKPIQYPGGRQRF